jgi:misacylated tRNA(Ala) deacylase
MTVEGEIDWTTRYCHMRMHTALHLLCSLITGDVTGGSIGAAKSRLDFNVSGEELDKQRLTTRLQALITDDLPVTAEWISKDELDRQPGLVRTMSVAPPHNGGEVRLIRIGDTRAPVDLQPCGGTHVCRTGEIGAVRIHKIENKGRQNKRIALIFDDS